MEKTKIYKPEINCCPLCGSKLKYRYTISNKVIQFSNGKFIRVKNLGYSCKNSDCLDDSVIYSSQTASKLCVKGYTYSAKVLALILVLKMKGKSRDEICDHLASLGVIMSDRNVDIINEKYGYILNSDYLNNIKVEYEYMVHRFKQIRISIDSLKVEDKRVVSIRDSFNNNQIGLHIFDINDIEGLKKILDLYINNINVKSITTVREITEFYKILKEVLNHEVEFYHFEKF